jgi:excisionase family DNA binding protein
MPLDDGLLTPREVARMLRVRVSTVTWWARIGALKPATRTLGGHRRYHRADVDAFSTASTVAPDPDRLRMECDAVRLYQQGWSIRQVAARFDCGYGTMRRILLRHISLRDRNQKRGRT